MKVTAINGIPIAGGVCKGGRGGGYCLHALHSRWLPGSIWPATIIRDDVLAGALLSSWLPEMALGYDQLDCFLLFRWLIKSPIYAYTYNKTINMLCSLSVNRHVRT